MGSSTDIISDSAVSDHSTCVNRMDIDENGNESINGNENKNKNLTMQIVAEIDQNNYKKSIVISDGSVGGIYDTTEMFSSFSKLCPNIYENDDICCLAKMYNCDEGTFRLNDVIEIIGIYTTDPLLSTVEHHGLGTPGQLVDMLDPFGGFDEDESQSLPPPR